jgi:hypothetical protein
VAVTAATWQPYSHQVEFKSRVGTMDVVFTIDQGEYIQGGPLNRALLKNCLDQDRQYLNECISSSDKGWFGVCRYLTTALFNKTVGGGDHLF